MPTPAINAQLRNAELGFRVQGTARTIPQSSALTTLFTVAGGRIMVNLLYGVVTTIVGGTTPALKLTATPTAGSANDMCTTLVITTDQVGAMFVCPVAVGSALIGAASTGVSGSVSGPGTGGQVVAPGTIAQTCAAADATGAIQWTLFYVPLDPATTVTGS